MGNIRGDLLQLCPTTTTLNSPAGREGDMIIQERLRVKFNKKISLSQGNKQ